MSKNLLLLTCPAMPKKLDGSIKISNLATMSHVRSENWFKVHIMWEGHKIWKKKSTIRAGLL